MKNPKDTSPRTSHKIESHEELAAILHDIMDDPPWFVTILINPKSDRPPHVKDYWPRVKFLCTKYAATAVQVDADTLVATWGADERELETLDKVRECARNWEGFYLFADGKAVNCASSTGDDIGFDIVFGKNSVGLVTSVSSLYRDGIAGRKKYRKPPRRGTGKGMRR